MEIINTDGESYQYTGALWADLEIDGIDLSDLIRDQIGIDDLYVFDGKVKPDKVTKITIDYHRVSKFKAKKPTSESKEVVTREYKEKLIIDRETETIEYIRNIGPSCVISQKYQVQGGVEALLDDLEAENLIKNIEGNPPNVIETPNKTKDYKILLDFKKGSQRIIRGTYDKHGLPKDWSDFAEAVLEFILSFCIGAILNPSVYNLSKRRKGEYIYCSVTFDEGNKTYYYLTDDDSIEVGDLVMVPAGIDNHLARARVVDIEYFHEDKAPLPIGKTKNIFRKCSNEDFE